MITAWDIYWVMQLDAIRAVILALAVASGAVAGAAGLTGGIEGNEDAKRAAKKAARVCFVAAMVTALIPSTKTAAAMIVLPAVVNNETIQAEAGDLYNIAKEALRALARPKTQEPDN